MARYIDIEPIEKCGIGDFYAVSFELLKAQPTADVVEVVRCKECKHWMGDGSEADGVDSVCRYWECDGLYKNDFCSCGERRES